MVARTIIGDAVEVEIEAADPAELHRAFQLDAVIARIGLEILEDRQVVLDRAGGRLVNVAVEPAVEDGRAQRIAVAGAAERRFQAPAALEVEVGIADLEALRAGMGAVGEQFLGRRRALGARGVEADPPAGRDRILGRRARR